MITTPGLRLAVLAALLASPLARADTPSDLPPEARAHNNAGIALAEALVELQAAYDAIPDPLAHRAGRGKVLGSIRGVLNDLHAATGDPQHLCRLRVLLETHLDGLQRALGPTAQAADIQGTRVDLHETNLALARTGHTCKPAEPVASEPAPAPPPPVVTAPASPRPPLPAASPRPAPSRRLQIVGGVVTATGFAGFALMTYGVVIVAAARAKIQTLTATIRDGGRLPTAEEQATEAGLHHRGTTHRALAIAAGVGGGVAVLTGVALLAAHRRSRLARVTPILGPQFTGASFTMRF